MKRSRETISCSGGGVGSSNSNSLWRVQRIYFLYTLSEEFQLLYLYPQVHLPEDIRFVEGIKL
jgi:hypothetical protein